MIGSLDGKSFHIELEPSPLPRSKDFNDDMMKQDCTTLVIVNTIIK